MKTITLLAQKGGSGKTTLSLNLAIAAVGAGKQVLVIDLDPQESAGCWSRLRQNDNPVIVTGKHQQLCDMLERCGDHKARAGGDGVASWEGISRTCQREKSGPTEPARTPHQHQHPALR